jgi:cobalamin-dependent methionine synthase I
MSHILLIGEKLNSSNPAVKTILGERDEESLIESAQSQLDCGASFIDLNASMLMGDEADALSWGARIITERLAAGISLDSPNVDLLLDLTARFGERAMLNSLTCDEEVLEKALPVLSKAGAAAVVILKDRTGIPPTVDGGLELAERAARRIAPSGIDPRKVFFDPVFAPVAASPDGLRRALQTTAALGKAHPECQRVGGLSNISYGLPMRRLLNRTFLSMAVSHGITALICDPTDARLKETLVAAEAVAGLDPGCRDYLHFYRTRGRKK